MQRLAASAVLSVLVCLSAAASAAEQLWEVRGFRSPESALPDTDAGVIYVTNLHGSPTEKNGKGFISKVSMDGAMVEPAWVTGLNSPKGMALASGKLYAADIDELVEIDPSAGKVTKRYAAKDAQFLNDVAAAPDGTIYVSDMFTNAIWRLKDSKFELWLQDEALKNPNGLLVEGGRLIVAGFGQIPQSDQPGRPANLVEVSISDRTVRDLGSGEPIGHLDGLEPLGAGTYLVSDWYNGALYRIEASGAATQLLDLNHGSADIGYIAETRTVLVPMMKDDLLVAYRLE